MIYSSFAFNTTRQAISVCWSLMVVDVICESRLQQIAHTVKFTTLENMITLKRSLIVQSQKLVTAYTRPQVRIVSSYFTGNYNIKQNTTMNVNRSQKYMGLYYTTSLRQNQGSHKKLQCIICWPISTRNLLRIGIFACTFSVKSWPETKFFLVGIFQLTNSHWFTT